MYSTKTLFWVLGTLLWIITVLMPLTVQALTWQTAANNPGNPDYHLPSYPIAFVAAEIVEQPDSDGFGTQGYYHIGTDVLSANLPDKDHHLWILLPDGQVKKLFPLDAHENIAGLIDTPQGELHKGSVVEPNVSEDGSRLYFGYFHDTTFNHASGSQLGHMSYKGSDLYAIDLNALLQDFNTDPATLPVMRLTQHVYDANGKQNQTDKNKDAMNQVLANSTGPNETGTVYMHAAEMRTANGLSLVYASDERRLLNSNAQMGNSNRNFNLHIADLADDGSLINRRQFQYYTTTSAMSPTPLRNGIAFSYQSSTEADRNWHMQGMDSVGTWYPIMGYGINPELFHLAAFCVKTSGANPGDYLVATRYYNANNEGFGSLWAHDLSILGENTYDNNTQWGLIPKQVGSTLITLGVNSNDYPAPKIGGEYVGKFTTPRCALPDELYASWSPTSANSKSNDSEGNRAIYHAAIVYRPDLEPFDPLNDLKTVIDDSDNDYNLIWPVPILDWQSRTGDMRQAFTPTAVDPATTLRPGDPFSQVGTSALWNTDRKPFDCWLGSGGQTPYSPNKAHTNINQENDLIHNNQDGLTWVQNPFDFCEYLDPSNVLGIAVNLTSNKPNLSAGFNPGYSAGGSGKTEAVRLLGVYSVVDQADQSFMATIPANSPFEFHLLHKRYGLKLADVRSWHSLKPRETRNDCGGCHAHESGQGIAFAGTVADSQPPLDMVGQTPYLTYDRFCQPVQRTSAHASRMIPEWNQHIWSGFDSYCGSCHNANVSGNSQALAALDYSDENEAYQKLKSRNYIDGKNGALGSPAFWAARGERTDGRDNSLAKYQPDYANGDWGFHYSTLHAHHANPALCDGTDAAAARWVYRFGQWIDNQMPRNTGSAYNYQFDRFHPSVDGAITGLACSPSQLRVGFWDDRGGLKQLDISLNGTSLAGFSHIRNGARTVDISQANLDDSIKVTALDFADNRQVYQKSVRQLVKECVLNGGMNIEPVAVEVSASEGNTAKLLP